jgi:NuA3 HAT complex component NTO1
MIYNKGDTPFNRIAKRIKSNAAPLLAELNIQSEGIDQSDVGDLEPHIEVLKALVAQDAEAEDRDNLASLFAFELEKPRPPTPPPPSPKVRKTLSAAERKAKWEEREARAKERAAMTGKPTRAAHALAKAFTEEAGLVASSDTEPGPSTRRRRDPSTVETESRSRRPQRGVVGTEYFAVVSDKERREKERALDLVTESVAPQDQFARFNVGWVLPEGSKRRRSERPPDIKPVQRE